MALVVLENPLEEPVTLARAKAHCRIDHADDDALLSAWIVAARQWVETFTRRALILTRFRQSWDAFPPARDPLTLHRPPLSSVVSLQYLDADGVLRSMPSDAYIVDADAEPARIVPALGQEWPDTADLPRAVRCEFIAGYGGASAVPEIAKAAILLIVGHLNEHRESTIETALAEIPQGVKFLLYPLTLGDLP